MVTDLDGTDWLVYHAWFGPPSNIHMYPAGRVVNIDPIVWDVQGNPRVGTPSDTLKSLPKTNVENVTQAVRTRPGQFNGQEYKGPGPAFKVAGSLITNFCYARAIFSGFFG